MTQQALSSAAALPGETPCPKPKVTGSNPVGRTLLTSSCRETKLRPMVRGDSSSRPVSRKQLLIAFGIATLAFDLALLVIDWHLEATGGPSILGLEFAGSERRAAEIMAEWGGHGRDLARLSLWIDFGFMLSYGTFFTLAAIATRDFARERGLRLLAVAGIAAPLLAASAALFDVAENIVWLLVLGGHAGGAAPLFATVCASLKFLLIGLAIAYVLWGLLARLYRLRTRRPISRSSG
jgi:hypothetical protein